MNPEPPREKTFFGEFSHGVDPKGRITVPAEWREKLEGEPYYLVTHSSGTHLNAIPPPEFDKLAAKIEASEFTEAQKAMFRGNFFSRATYTVTDRQGRLLLPEKARADLNLRESTVLIGAYQTFKIFNRETLEAQRQAEAADYHRLATHFGV